MTDPTTQRWRSRPVFISSTFRDMQAERDWLKHHVFPELAERLRQRRHLLEPIDLRFGVETVTTAEEEAKELLVLKVCLDEIRRSRPFIVVLLGERYGWVPEETRMQAAAAEAGFRADVGGKSVTALEIEFGIFKESPEQQRRCFFYLRDPLPCERMPPEVSADYSEAYAGDPGAPARQARLDALKHRLQSDPELGPRVRRYKSGWDDKRFIVTDLESFGRMVLEDLWAELEAETTAFARQPDLTPEETDREALEEFIEYRSRGFIGRSDQVDSTLGFLNSPPAEGKPWALCLTGPPGAGKSAFFARMHRELEADSSLLLLAHAAGVGACSADVEATLRRWMGELNRALPQGEQEAALPADAKPEDIDRAFATLLHRASRTRRVAVLLDAPNQFLPVPRAQFFTWLPKPWPANARLLVTTLPGSESEALARLPGTLVEPLRPLDEQESIELARAVSHRYHREFNPDVIAAVINRWLPDGTPAAGNPLWLTLAMEQINLLDADDLVRAKTEYKGPTDERLHRLLLDVATGLPPDVEGLYGWLLQQSEKAHGAAWVAAFASPIALSRSGWRESDLLDLVPRLAKFLDPEVQSEEFGELKLAALRRSFRAHVMQRGALAQWDFFHAQPRAAVLRRHAGSEALQNRLYSAIADYLETLPASDPLRQSEMMWHLIGSGNSGRTARFYCELPAPLGMPNHPATATLAEHLLSATGRIQEHRLNLVASFLQAESLGQELLYGLCNRLQFDLNDRLQKQAPLWIRLRLLQRVQASLGGLYPTGISPTGWHTGIWRQFRRLLQSLFSNEPSNASWQRDISASHSASHIKVGEVLYDQGDLSGALTAYRQGLAGFDQLVAADPSNTGWQYGLSASRNKVGDVLCDQGDLSGALAAYRQSLAGFEQLVAAHPSNTDWQCGLSVGRIKVGNVLCDQGDLSGALAAYRQSLAGFEQLVAADPSNTDWQRRLSVSRNKVGNVLCDQGDLSGALAVYRQSLTDRERLVAADPSNAGWQEDLSDSRNHIGNVLRKQGDLSGALAAYRQSLTVRERLAAADPSNAGWQRGLSVSRNHIGNVLRKQGDLSGALATYRQSLTVRERLAVADPSNAVWQEDLSFIQEKVGDVLHEQGDLSGALAVYRQSIAVRERLAAADPSNASWQRGLSVSHDRIGSVLRDEGDLPGALSAYRKSLAVGERLAPTDSSNAVWQEDLSLIQEKVGDVLYEQGDLSGTLTAYRQSLAGFERLAAADPSNSTWQRELWGLYYRMADMLERSGKKEAIDWWRRAYAVLTSMKQRGLFISPGDEKFLDIIRRKCGGV